MTEIRLQPALLISLLGALCPLSSLHAAAGNKAAEDIAKLEDVYSQSFVTGDTQIADRVVADDFVGFEPNGKTSDKAAILADVRGEARPVSLKITALTIRLHGDTAIALGTEEDRTRGTAAVTHRRWLDTWRNMPAGWRLVASAEIVPQP